MLILKDKLLNKPVLSLRSGGRVGLSLSSIINPNNLKIEGIYCQDNSREQKVLLPQDIRDLMGKGLIVNDHESLTDIDDLIRLKPVMELEFDLIKKPVYSENKKKIGKVVDYAVDSKSLYIQKLYVTPSLIKQIGGTLSVDRTQVVEITDKRVIIKDPLSPVKAEEAVSAPATASPAV